jgi:sugar lactone lactonase YvrE
MITSTQNRSHTNFFRPLPTLRASVLAIILMFMLTTAALALTITNGMSATIVLGQSNFTSSGPSTTQTGMISPVGIYRDPTTGKLFVSDEGNHRVLRFATASSLINGSAAEAVLGQPDYTTNIITTTQSGMNIPDGIAMDSSGRLWLADSNNNRVLRFDKAASKANGAPADGVLGQADFTHKFAATTQSGMRFLRQVFVDSTGTLWVSDSDNNRVLRFDNAASKANGAPADGVLGQADFTHNFTATTQSGMNSPRGLFLDSSGRLWVADRFNHRVLRFDNAASKANGAPANGVLGQADFTHNFTATTQSGMRTPSGVTIDPAGNLYVADSDNNRVLVFNNAATKGNGANADNVLGQTNFTTGTANTGGISATTLSFPSREFYDPYADLVWVSDLSNNRVLAYGTPSIKTFLPSILR